MIHPQHAAESSNPARMERAMHRWVISLLGPFQITRDGAAVATPLGVKTQALLAYLAAEADRPHRREVLAGLLWPDQPDEAARHSLRQALHQLHGAFAAEDPPPLLITPQTLQLNPAADCAVDVTEFTAAIADCERHPHRRREACRACIARLQHAADLYRGHFLADFFLKDSVAFEEWALVKREQLARLAHAGLHTLAEHHALVGEYELMARVARQQLSLDPLAEDAHRQLMTALSWGGQRTAALAHYKALRRTLAAELAAPPEAETVALHGRIEVGTHERPRRPLLHNWPGRAQLTTFVGRETELAQIAAQLGSADVRLLTLLGPGGVGKTRLALETAAREACGFRDGACWVALEAADTPDLVVSAIASALRFALAGPTDPLVQLCVRLRDAELLLVLDNCETCVAAGPLLTDLLAGCPQLRILATSREPFHVRGERRVPVAPLPTTPVVHRSTCAVSSASPWRRCRRPAPRRMRSPARRPWPSSWSGRAPSGPTSASLRRTPWLWLISARGWMACRWRSSWPPRTWGRSRRRRSWPASPAAWRCSPLARPICQRASAPCAPRSHGATPCSARPSRLFFGGWRSSPGAVRWKRPKRCAGMAAWTWGTGSRRCWTRDCYIAQWPMWGAMPQWAEL
jgi:DNA-binding SARP family transcriptional activator